MSGHPPSAEWWICSIASVGHAGRVAVHGCETPRWGFSAVLYAPINIRYATGTSNMQVYALHNPCRYVFVATDGPVVLFDFKDCEHLSKDYPAVDEARDAISWYHFVTGDRALEKARLWDGEIEELVRLHGRGERRLAVDRLDPAGLRALEGLGVRVIDGTRSSFSEIGVCDRFSRERGRLAMRRVTHFCARVAHHGGPTVRPRGRGTKSHSVL